MYRAIKWFLVLWTLLMLGSCIFGLGGVGEVAEETGSDAAAGVALLGWSFAAGFLFMVWGAVVVPLGVLAMVVRKKSD